MKLALLQDATYCRNESELLRAALPARGYQLQSFAREDMLAGKIELQSDCLIAGETDVVDAALRQLGVEPPLPNDYPNCLRDRLGRKVWLGTVGDLQARLATDYAEPVFAKPACDRKLFRGRVFHNAYGIGGPNIVDLPDGTPLWFSEVAPIISEFRFYVVNSRIVCRENYDGDPRDAVDERVVVESIAALDAAGESYAAYAIDFGLLRDGRTVLIEMNDGYAIGTHYEISADDYAEVIVRRWEELTASRIA